MFLFKWTFSFLCIFSLVSIRFLFSCFFSYFLYIFEAKNNFTISKVLVCMPTYTSNNIVTFAFLVHESLVKGYKDFPRPRGNLITSLLLHVFLWAYKIKNIINKKKLFDNKSVV